MGEAGEVEEESPRSWEERIKTLPLPGSARQLMHSHQQQTSARTKQPTPLEGRVAGVERGEIVGPSLRRRLLRRGLWMMSRKMQSRPLGIYLRFSHQLMLGQVLTPKPMTRVKWGIASGLRSRSPRSLLYKTDILVTTFMISRCPQLQSSTDTHSQRHVLDCLPID